MPELVMQDFPKDCANEVDVVDSKHEVITAMAVDDAPETDDQSVRENLSSSDVEVETSDPVKSSTPTTPDDRISDKQLVPKSVATGNGVCAALQPAAADSSGNRFQVLGYEQVNRLHRVMETCVPIHGRGNFPTLDVKLRSLVQVVRTKLKADGIVVRDVRLNGGAASYILGNETSEVYNDLDLIFGIDLTNQNDLKRAKDAVLNSLLDFLPRGVNKERISGASLNEGYVRKMVKIYDDANRWSLISLSNVRGRNVELKFADRMRRQFEFSVDSFQIILDSLLTFYELESRPAMTEHFYPTVVAESVYGDFDVALDHLNRKLIATRNPEEIRGGGLLKYCNLLVRGYMPTSDADVSRLERYMCSRFFIDFPDVESQRTKLEHYLADHFSDDGPRQVYLTTLWATINASTVCLMGHERRQTLVLIESLARAMIERRVYGKAAAASAAGGLYQHHPAASLPTVFDQTGTGLVIDQVYYGPFACCPSFMYEQQQPSYYAVYTYEYTGSSVGGLSPLSSAGSSCADLTSPSSSTGSSSSCCPYCIEACPECSVTTTAVAAV